MSKHNSKGTARVVEAKVVPMGLAQVDWAAVFGDEGDGSSCGAALVPVAAGATAVAISVTASVASAAVDPVDVALALLQGAMGVEGLLSEAQAAQVKGQKGLDALLQARAEADKARAVMALASFAPVQAAQARQRLNVLAAVEQALETDPRVKAAEAAQSAQAEMRAREVGRLNQVRAAVHAKIPRARLALGIGDLASAESLLQEIRNSVDALPGADQLHVTVADLASIIAQAAQKVKATYAEKAGQNFGRFCHRVGMAMVQGSEDRIIALSEGQALRVRPDPDPQAPNGMGRYLVVESMGLPAEERTWAKGGACVLVKAIRDTEQPWNKKAVAVYALDGRTPLTKGHWYTPREVREARERAEKATRVAPAPAPVVAETAKTVVPAPVPVAEVAVVAATVTKVAPAPAPAQARTFILAPIGNEDGQPLQGWTQGLLEALTEAGVPARLGQPGDDAKDGTVVAGLLKKVPGGSSLELYLAGCDETSSPITCSSTARTATTRKSEILQGAVKALHGLA